VVKDTRCYKIRPGEEWPLIAVVYDCPVEFEYGNVNDIKDKISNLLGELVVKGTVEFSSNEAIGSRTMLFRLHFKPEGSASAYIGVRLVATGDEVRRMLLIVPRELESLVGVIEGRLGLIEYDPGRDLRVRENIPLDEQTYIPYPVIYAVKGLPRVSPGEWFLEVKGLVEKAVVLKYDDLVKQPLTTITVDFHCVTGWSVRSRVYRGVDVKYILETARPFSVARWVYVMGYDGYSAVIPFEEFSKGLLVLYEGDKPLPLEHGGPARLMFPQLYGWKSVKWVRTIEFAEKYKDGYWEVMGYHPRGRVDFRERFKEY
jgi:DMSO/TMAO reductase YedYZ molybdopterin-dependent catalytic subunit